MYRSVYELTKEEFEELRESYFYQLIEEDEDILEDITEPSEISDGVIQGHYKEVQFTEDDFFCNIE